MLFRPRGDISLSFIDRLMMDCFSPTFRSFWKLIYKKQWLARKTIHYLCEGRIEKSVLRDHRSFMLRVVGMLDSIYYIKF